jgi:GMP synthase-like glutamine amidotransferase
MFQIPSNGKLLAIAQGCPHQALKVGKNAYGLQFHIEVTDRSIKEWSDEYAANDLEGRGNLAKSMMDDYWKYQEIFNAQAKKMYHNFLNIINNCHPEHRSSSRTCAVASKDLKISLDSSTSSQNDKSPYAKNIPRSN